MDKDGARVRVMAGESSGVTGPIALRNPGLLLDVTLAKGASFTQPVSKYFSSEELLFPQVLNLHTRMFWMQCASAYACQLMGGRRLLLCVV